MQTTVNALLDPSSVVGAVAIGALIALLATIIAAFLRRSARRIGARLTDGTTLQFASVLGQWLIYLLAVGLYAHLIPELRTLGSTMLAGAGILSVVVGLAAQDTLGNLIAGFSLLMSRAMRVGDTVRVYAPNGVIEARVEGISLGFTTLRDAQGNEVVIPNGVAMASAIVRVAHPDSTKPSD
ncbi:mechanosensitive ion channel family protein [Stenotrophomonas maltophilia]|uniref:mechanosensitive ion channel family protein n=1 Tax=Stenotrophomonas maltophilia TaxID=40324 RepID=UPI0012B1225F|nr:mechanosensitive ion channel domain-containing protein [Stenotrophomonas maltophilia]QGL80480.1 mechanosensitive ion channel [Stenotrophomonas maltophilia]